MITSLGAGSGLDLGQLVDQLVAAERQPPLDRLNIREAGLQAKISAFASLQGAADKLRTALDSLKELDPGRSAAVSGAVASLSASASDTAALGTYSIAVDQLAQAHSLNSGAYANSSTVVGGGTLTITLGTTDYVSGTDTYNSFTPNPELSSVAIDVGPNATVAELRDAINAADAGVSAILVADATGQRLLLSSAETGSNQSLEIQVLDDDGNPTDGAGLSAFAFNSAATNLQQTVAASEAILTVNGLQISSHSNQSIEAIEGLTLDLLSVTTDQNAVIKVQERTNSVHAGLDEFVGAYNELVDLVSELARFDPDTGQTGTLFSDTTLRAMTRDIRVALSTQVAGAPDGINSLIELGIDTDDNGRLSVDRDRLNAALDVDFGAAVAAINSAGKDYLGVIDQYTGSNGLIGLRRDGAQDRLDRIAEDREQLDRRMGSFEQRVTRRFANLDTLLSNLQSTSQFISTQLASLNISRQSGNS